MFKSQGKKIVCFTYFIVYNKFGSIKEYSELIIVNLHRLNITLQISTTNKQQNTLVFFTACDIQWMS